MKKKIVIVSLFGISEKGGVERVAFYLKNIFDEKYDVDILEMKRSFGKLNFIIYPIWFSILLYFKKYDLVIAQAWQAWLYPSDIVICHGTTREELEQVKKDRTLGAMYISLLERISLRLAKRIWAVSNNAKDEICKWYNVSPFKIIVVNNFVDEDCFYPINKTNNEEKCILIFSGRLNYRKGADRILELANYIEKIDNVELLIACNDETGIDKFKDFNNTKILKGLSMFEMHLFYSSGDIFYFPTRFEGFSMAVLESLCCGIPVVGSSYALPEEFDNLEFTKRLDNNSPQEIVEFAFMLKKVYTDKRTDIFEIIKAKFGKSQYKERILKEIYELLN